MRTKRACDYEQSRIWRDYERYASAVEIQIALLNKGYPCWRLSNTPQSPNLLVRKLAARKPIWLALAVAPNRREWDRLAGLEQGGYVKRVRTAQDALQVIEASNWDGPTRTTRRNHEAHRSSGKSHS